MEKVVKYEVDTLSSLGIDTELAFTHAEFILEKNFDYS